jgi:two-component system cell cycle sensor histidine kinase/response regulator CckA
MAADGDHNELNRLKARVAELERRLAARQDAASGTAGEGDTLHESQERFRQLAESIREVFWLTDPLKNQVVYISPAYEEVWGRTCDSVYASPMSWLDAIHPEDRGRVQDAALSKQVAGDYDEEYRIVRSDGAVRWIRDRAFPVRNQAGEVFRIAGIAEDITEHKQAEEALQKTTRDLQTVIQASPMAFIEMDREGNVMTWNLAAERIFGWSQKEVIGHPIPYVPEGDQRESNVLWDAVMKGQFLRGVEIRRRRKDGVLIDLSLWAAPLRDATGQVISTIGVLDDVTEHKRLEEQLRQAQKLEAIGRLAGGVAHDFNNLLTVIIGHSQRMLRNLPAEDRNRRSAEGIKQAGERAASLTRQLLAFGHKQILHPKLMDLNVVVSNMADMLQRLIGEDIRLVTTLHAGPCLIKADAGQIEQILMNLAINARDAMPEGGSLMLGTSVTTAGEASTASRIPLPPGGNYVMLSVRDTGCGMDAEVQAHAFEPFFTTKEVGKGTGLGLATVYGIVVQSGGAIDVVSEPGQGAAFTILLPRPDDCAATDVRADQSTPETMHTETILLVEDDALVREFLRDHLAGQGYRVLEAGLGEQALRLCGTNPDPFHLLLTDVVIPDMSGRTLAERAVTLRPAMKVLFMSGYTDDVVLRHGISEEVAAFIQKPFLPDDLSCKVREVLDASKQ